MIETRQKDGRVEFIATSLLSFLVVPPQKAALCRRAQLQWLGSGQSPQEAGRLLQFPYWKKMRDTVNLRAASRWIGPSYAPKAAVFPLCLQEYPSSSWMGDSVQRHNWSLNLTSALREAREATKENPRNSKAGAGRGLFWDFSVSFQGTCQLL